LIGALILAAAAVLLTGLIVAIRDLRRPAPAARGASRGRLEAAPPYGGAPDGSRASRHEVDPDADDGRAIAA
jgi:hypothetical protein